MPIAFSDQELDRLLPLARESITEACIYDFQSSTDAKQRSVHCELGISMAVPRACLRADRFASLDSVNFVAINTDELTQLVFGVEKEAAKRVMSMYIDRNILARDPFVCLDALGVGQLIQLAINNFREKRGNAKVGILIIRVRAWLAS
jgi:phosphoenolpyruvate synthase/pyruvate phosphate dikinase